MLVVKDAMVLIHLSKLTLIEKSCKFFEEITIPNFVNKEVVKKGKKEGYKDAVLIEEIIEDGLIEIKKIENPKLIDRANKFNIQGGEAEAVALYWQEEADLLATDDDNVRNKRVLLELDLIGTPPIIWKLFENGMIDENKFCESLETLRDIGWFSNAVIDKILNKGKNA